MHESKPATSVTRDKHGVLNTPAAIGNCSIVLVRLSYSAHFIAQVELLTHMADGGDGHIRSLNVRNGAGSGLSGLGRIAVLLSAFSGFSAQRHSIINAENFNNVLSRGFN